MAGYLEHIVSDNVEVEDEGNSFYSMSSNVDGGLLDSGSQPGPSVIRNDKLVKQIA